MEAKQWALLAGVGALLVAKNPRIQVLLAEVAEGVALKQAQQREAQQQAAFLAKRPIIEIPVFKPLQLKDSVTPSPPYTPPLDEPLARLLDHPGVILILGHRGNGKTALAFRLQEPSSRTNSIRGFSGLSLEPKRAFRLSEGPRCIGWDWLRYPNSLPLTRNLRYPRTNPGPPG